jgi:acyl-CoA synthetase (NDP forming)
MMEMKDCETIIQKALEEGRPSTLTNEAQRIFALHHIPTPPSIVTSNSEEAVLKAKEIGFPVVLKAISPQILHKSDVGGVILNIDNEIELQTAYERINAELAKNVPSAKILGILLQKMMPASTEVIIGAIRDPQFGPSIMFGLGGIFTEIYDDVAFRVAPIDEVDATNLIRELKGHKLLEGARGKPPADIDSIVSILTNVSNLMLEHSSISQLDLNPVIVYPNSACAVDFRIIIGQTGGDK